MAKLIVRYAPSELLSVEKLSEVPDYDWSWRLEYIGRPGYIDVFESQYKHKGEIFIYLGCFDGNQMTTGYGTIEIEEDRLTITTKNSRYEFSIGKEYHPWQENANKEKGPSD